MGSVNVEHTGDGIKVTDNCGQDVEVGVVNRKGDQDDFITLSGSRKVPNPYVFDSSAEFKDLEIAAHGYSDGREVVIKSPPSGRMNLDPVGSGVVNITSMIRAVPEVITLRDKMRTGSKRFSASQLKVVIEKWKKDYDCKLFYQFLDSTLDVPRAEDMREAVRMSGTSSEKYALPDNDCDRFSARLKGLLEVMLSDPENDFNGAATVARFEDFIAHHSFIIVIVLGTDDETPEIMFFEPQSDGEIKVSRNPKDIYNVNGNAEAIFG